MRLITILIFVLLQTVFTANGLLAIQLSGTIVSADSREPVVEANILVEELDLKLRSELDGRYSIRIDKPGTYRLNITHVSFEKKVLDINIGSNDTSIVIALSPRT